MIVACHGVMDAAGPMASPRTATSDPGNPFAAAHFFINPEYVAEVEATLSSAPANAVLLRRAEAFPTAVWLDSIAKARRASQYLDVALAQQKQAGQPVVTVFTLYDLPGRDCSAVASAGELRIGGGEARYKSEFIDAIAAQFRAHSSQRIVAILEPDSLANLATNLGVAQCAEAEQPYRHSIAYAVATLSMPHVSLSGCSARRVARVGRQPHQDRAHLPRGTRPCRWPNKIHGFSTNVSNFNTLSDGDGKRLEPSDPCPDELTYVEKLSASLQGVGITGKGYIIDTSRNGRGGVRAKWGFWCNVKGAGLGERPRASPAPGVDAYFWVKPAGESDGASDPATPGYDAACAAEGSASGAPHAGEWFTSYFLELVQNASPPL